jgi:hypothetical protein
MLDAPAWFFLPVEGLDFMIQINTFNFYSLAKALAHAEHLKDEPYLGMWVYHLTEASTKLRDFLNADPETLSTNWRGGKIDITHSREAGHTLLKKLGEATNLVYPVHAQRLETPKLGREPIPVRLSQEVSLLRLHIIRFETNLEAELSECPTFYVSQIGIFSTKALLSHAEDNLTPRARERLSAKTIRDIKDAGRCLAVHEFTACGFHAMRAFETEARDYYTVVTGDADYPTDLGMLAKNLQTILDQEERKANQGKSTPSVTDSRLGLIISVVRRLNKTYRNPIMHPDMILNEDGAREVFGGICEVIGMIRQDLEERRHETRENQVDSVAGVPEF